MTESQLITVKDGQLFVPNRPVIPFIEGDGIGPDIWNSTVRVLDAAVFAAYQTTRSIEWLPVLAGEASYSQTGTWLPSSTLEAFRKHVVGIKGPLTTPIGGGIRSLNVALRQQLDLYVCLRPVRWLPGVPSPVKTPEAVDMVVFRENSEDIYTGIEFAANSDTCKQFNTLLKEHFPEEHSKVRFPDSTGFGIKPVSQEGTERLVKAAIKYALDNNRKSITLVHKGNIMKFTEGAFRDWGYETAREHFGAIELDGGPWHQIKHNDRSLIVKDVIADAFLQQILTRPSEYDVIATLNLNGDYISDALAAQVGGIGIAPGGNINYQTGHAIFEATHGTAPKYTGQDKVNPSSLILSGEMMLRYIGWHEAADCIVRGIKAAIDSKHVTYDFARLMDGAKCVTCSQFANNIITNMNTE